MLNFQQKIFLIYVIVFLLLLALMSPLASIVVRGIVKNAMENRAKEIIKEIQSSRDNDEITKRLKALKPRMFFRVSVITNHHTLLYDSHIKSVLGSKFVPNNIVNYPEVKKAFQHGKGYAEGYSDLLEQKFAYTAITFDFHGNPYVIRTAFPYRYIKEFVNDFEVGFLIVASFILILFSFMTWLIINRLTKPFQKIIAAVCSYQENEKNPLPELRELSKKVGNEEVGKLAKVLVSLSDRLQSQISYLKEERNEKEVLLESLVEGVIAINPEHQITFANLSALKFLPLKKNDLLGMSFKDLGQDKAFELLLNCQREGQPISDTLRIEKSGRVIYLDIVAVPKRDNTGAILVMIDKSDHYKILEMRKDFIANASHELKTPITIIRGFAETIHEHPDLEKELMHDITGKIVRNCDRMATVVRDLIALADIENIPSSRIEAFDLEEQLKHVIQMVQEIYKEAQITLIKKVKGPIFLEGDYDLLEMAFINLISNAAKYSHPPAKIFLTVNQEKEKVIISIADKGIGIPKNELPRIFERFYRVDKKMGGSGLGLSIVETVVKKHFGQLFVESEVGKGTTFTLQLPLYHPKNV